MSAEYIEMDDIWWCAAHDGVIDLDNRHCDMHIPRLHSDDNCPRTTLYRKVAA